MVLDNTTEERKRNIRNRTAKPLFFGGLTSAVIVQQGGGGWFNFELPVPFLISTIVIALSSVSYIMAISLAKQNKIAALKIFIGLTLLLGITFMVTQFLGWRSLMGQGLYFTGPGHHTSASYFYVLTWAHLAHTIGGIISLGVVFVKSLREIYNSKNLLGLQLSATYWHFLGALWVYLFLFLNYINQNF